MAGVIFHIELEDGTWTARNEQFKSWRPKPRPSYDQKGMTSALKSYISQHSSFEHRLVFFDRPPLEHLGFDA